MRSPIDWTQEIRFSIVMYGGVSLAIYINGVAQELLSLVRATARGGDGVLGREPRGTEKVYRKLGQLLAHGAATATEQPDESAAIRTRFVVDVISGTSAGGINGIYLAKALANDQDMEGLKRLWVTEGDIGLLINDARSVRDISPLPASDPPRSLLNGRRMYLKLVQALEQMDAAGSVESPGSSLVDELDVFITATDIRGAVVPIQLADRLVHERRHRNVFRFSHSAAGDNDFTRANNPVLGFAARSTSAFPFAFEPMTVDQANDVLGRFADGDARLDGAKVARYLEEETDDTNVATRAFGDGGYLDNKPFGYAIDAGANRRQERPVHRKLFYIEPSPEQLDPDAGGDEPREPPTALENVQAALLKVPRYESIREDLQRILAQNRLVERVQRVTRGLEDDFRKRPAPTPATASAAWADQDLGSMIERYGIAYGSYHRLKVAQVTDQIAASFAAAAGFRAGSDAFEAARHLVRAWRDHHYTHHVERDRPGGRASFNRFLLTYDLEYRMRRLRFVLRELDTLALGGFEALAALRSEPELPGAASAPPGMVVDEDSLDGIARAVAEVRPVIEALLADFRATRARLLASGSANPVWPSEPPPSPAAGTKDEPGIWPYLERTLMSLPSAAERDALARRVVVDGEWRDPEPEDGRDAFARAMDAWLRRAVRQAADRVAETIEGVSRHAARTIDGLLMSGPDYRDAGAKDYLRRQYDRFEEYDLVTYPVLYATDGEGESAAADVHRISPEDATSLSVNKHRLAGTALHNFGAFLDARWRRSDLRWGRLDAADRIITVLLPGPEHAALRASLIQEAQKAILEEDLVRHGQDELVRVMATAIAEDAPADVFGRTRKELEVAAAAVLPATADLDLIYATYGRADFDVDRTLDREAMFRNASRASSVIGSMLQDMAGPRNLVRTPAEWVARASRAGWMLVETAMPGSAARTVVRHLAAVFVLFSALLVVVGWLAEGNDLRNLGLAWLAISIAFLGVQMLAENFIRGGGALWRTLRVIAATLVVGVVYLAVVGARELFGWSFGLSPERLDTVALGAGAVLILAALLREARAMYDGLKGWAARASRWVARASRWVARAVRFGRFLQRLRPRRRAGAEPIWSRLAAWPGRAIARLRGKASLERPGA